MSATFTKRFSDYRTAADGACGPAVVHYSAVQLAELAEREGYGRNLGPDAWIDVRGYGAVPLFTRFADTLTPVRVERPAA